MKRDAGKCQKCKYWCDKCHEINHSKQGQHQTGETLCWCCKHAIPDKEGTKGCEWSIYKQPVDGWKVSQVKWYRNDDGKSCYTYRVDDCPKFERG